MRLTGYMNAFFVFISLSFALSRGLSFSLSFCFMHDIRNISMVIFSAEQNIIRSARDWNGKKLYRQKCWWNSVCTFIPFYSHSLCVIFCCCWYRVFVDEGNYSRTMIANTKLVNVCAYAIWMAENALNAFSLIRSTSSTLPLSPKQLNHVARLVLMYDINVWQYA